MTPSRLKVLVTDRFETEAYAKLRDHPQIDAIRAPTPDIAAGQLDSIDALVIRSRSRIDSTVLARAPQLKVIVTSTSGFDHIDLAACVKRGVKVMFTPDANASSAAELTWALVLACARKLTSAQASVANGDWQREPLIGLELSGLTYGVIGLGRIGKRVARIAQAFGMNVIGFDPYAGADAFKNAGCESVGFKEDVFKRAHVISCHVPATRETNDMITLETFKQSGELQIFVNTSRGSIVKDQTLVDALERGLVKACGLDVFENEPLPLSSKLRGRADLVTTPHIGATTDGAFKASSMAATEKIIAFAERGIVTDELPGSEPWVSR